MSSNENSLLLRIRGDAAGGKAAIAETRAAIASLRATTGTEFAAIQNVGSKAFSSISDNLNVFIGQRIPLVGGAFVRVTENLKGFGAESSKTTSELAKFDKVVEGLATKTGKTGAEIKTFLTSFVQLESQAKRDTAAIETFGAAAAQKLIPQLEKAGTQLSTLAVAGEEAATGLAGVLATMGPLGIAAAGIAVQVVAAGIALGVVVKVATGVAESFLALTKSAAGFRGALLDTSQQLGISTETLSAFEILAKTTGGDLGSISASLGIFQRKLEEAQDPLSKTGKLFTELGIETLNTEAALRQTLTRLAAMPEGFHQTATALELFGRGGKSILAILKEMHGDLDGAIARFREMGLIISREDAKAADEFNDQLEILHFQFRALVGREGIPAATAALKELSDLLKENRVLVDALGVVVKGFGLGIKGGFVDPIVLALDQLAPVLTKTAEYWERIERAMRSIGILTTTNFGAAAAGAGSPFAGLDVGGTGTFNLPGAKSGLFKASLEASKVQAEKELEVERNRREILALEFEKKNSDLEKHYKQLQQLTDNHLATLQGQITKEREAVQAGFERGEFELAEFEKRKDDLNQRATEAQNKRDEETRRLRFEKQQSLDKQEIEFRERSFAITETRRQGELDRFKNALDKQAIAESDLLTKQLEFLKDAHKERIGIIDFEIKALSTSTERKKELDAEKAKAEQEYTDEFKRLTRERIDAVNAEAAAGGPSVAPSSPDAIAQQAGAAANAAAGLVPILQGNVSAIDQLFRAINENLTGDTQTAALSGLQAMVDVFGQLGQAVGQAAAAWVLYGNSGTSVRKVTAEILASITQMAIVKAAFEIAEGLAALALAFFGIPNAGPSASTHFAAAAAYAGIAGIAAIAGRQVAGDSFNRSGAGGGAPSSGGGAGTTSGPPKTVEADRRSGFQSQTFVHELTFRVKGDAVVDSFVRDYDLNGRTRIKIMSDG